MNKKKVNSFYLSQLWKNKRLEILKSDNYKCQLCKEEERVTSYSHTILEIDRFKEFESRGRGCMINIEKQLLNASITRV